MQQQHGSTGVIFSVQQFLRWANQRYPVVAEIAGYSLLFLACGHGNVRIFFLKFKINQRERCFWLFHTSSVGIFIATYFLTTSVMDMNHNQPESVLMNQTYHPYWQQRIADTFQNTLDAYPRVLM
ncbi:hypothetical protein ACE60T_005684, partial [Salmonella enterica]